MIKTKKPTVAVLFLGRKGGGPIYAYEMAKGLIENGCIVHLFISRYVENLNAWLSLKPESIEIIKTYKGKFSFVLNTLLFRCFKYPRLKHKYKNCNVDACYIPMGSPWDCYVVNSLKNPQKILTIHDPIEHSSNNSNDKMLSRAVSLLNKGIRNKKPDDIVVLSKVFIETMASKNIVGKDRIHVVPHCIFNYYGDVSTSKMYEYDEEKINFLFFGRIDRYKGLDILAEAFRRYSLFNAKATLTIVGSGDFSFYRAAFKSLDNITVINRWIKDEEVASFFAPHKNVILILPYIDATQSGVIPISMSAGVPIIATNTGGLAEQIQDNVTGFLVPPSDPESLSKKMLEVSNLDNSSVVENAKKYISQFTGFELAKKIIEIIR